MPLLTIRTKLLAGLVLVLCISAVLTVNTLVGLYSYRNSIKAFESKTQELTLGNELWERVAQLDAQADWKRLRGSDEDARGFERGVRLAEESLEVYRDRLNATLRRGRDPDQGKGEIAKLIEIDSILASVKRRAIYPSWGDSDIFDLAFGGEQQAERTFKQQLAQLRSCVASLPVPTSHDMNRLVSDARLSYRTNLWVAWSSGALVVPMILVLARGSYSWIFRPIRQLHASVRRVAQGDLGHRCTLDTGDEMQELAQAFNDMTARLQQTCQNLERQVEQRSRQLVRSEQLASVGFLAAGVAHEINNPLASISLGAESLERRLRGMIPRGGPAPAADDVWRCLAMIQSEAFRCKGITEKLLDFSRMRDHERQPSSLAHLVADVIDVVQHMGRYREKHLVLACSAEVIAEVNPQELKQVVLNLVVNALDSMDAGGTLEIRVGREKDRAMLVFSDDGCGMTPDVLANIFEPFYTRNRSGKGTGLGLSITHRIITDHAGEIDAASDGPGQGSRFTVRLPLRAVPHGSPLAPAPGAPGPADPRTPTTFKEDRARDKVAA